MIFCCSSENTANNVLTLLWAGVGQSTVPQMFWLSAPISSRQWSASPQHLGGDFVHHCSTTYPYLSGRVNSTFIFHFRISGGKMVYDSITVYSSALLFLILFHFVHTTMEMFQFINDTGCLGKQVKKLNLVNMNKMIYTVLFFSKCVFLWFYVKNWK